MNVIRRFLYRSPRYIADCRMDFLYADTVALGLCSSLSESGLRGTFSQVVPRGSEGLLTIYQGDQKFEVKAFVESTREHESRVRFEYESDQQRSAMSNLIKSLGTNPSR